MKKISLILTSQNRPDVLDRFINSLVNQKTKYKIELIFINQGSYDPFAYIKIPDFINFHLIKSDRLSLSKARNLGLKNVSGDIVGFPDDDCWYDENLLERVFNFFDKNKTIDVLCANVFDPDRNIIYGNRPIGVQKRVHFHNLFILPISVGIFCRVSALKLVGLNFDELLGVGAPIGSGEETELMMRFLDQKLQIEYDGDIQVFHPVSDYIESDYLKFYQYGFGFGYLNAKILRRGHFSVLLHFFEMLARSILGCILYVHKPSKRRVYWFRFCGILKGSAVGISRS